MNPRRFRLPAPALAVVFFCLAGLPASGAAEAAAADRGALTEADRGDLESFARKAELARRLGATHVPITDRLPPASWQFDVPGDPYPAWYVERPDFLKLFPPAALQPFVDLEYNRRVTAILAERCAVLRRLGLRAHWGSNIPQVLPEAFFAAHPAWRGPRVDQPNRSRTARFAPCVDRPEVLALYAAAMKALLERCPEIDTFAFLTQDSGSGFCWLPSLYPGLNGNSDCRSRPVSERVSGFLTSLHDAVAGAGHPVEISLNPITPRPWMIPTFSPEELDALVHHLPRGVAVQGREGPDGRAFTSLGSSDAYAHGAFYPVVGLAVPDLAWLRRGRSLVATTTAEKPARRLISLRPDEDVIEFSAELENATTAAAHGNVVDRLAALRDFAGRTAGAAEADDLVEAWLQIDDAERRLDVLNFGDMLQFGHVLNRWIVRPMVPFPAELPAAATAYYRRYLFQAKGDDQAADLVDIQAMRMYEGYGARLLFQRAVELAVSDLEAARRRIDRIAAATTGAARPRWQLFARRLDVVICLLHSAEHMVAYQAQLDQVKQSGNRPEANPPLGARNDWEREDLLRLAREEIDTAARLRELLGDAPATFLDLAPTAAGEGIMRLGPDLPAQLQRKIDIMNAHWRDYDRLLTAPNP